MDCLSRAVEKIYRTLIRVDKEIQKIVIVDKAKSYHSENFLNCTDDWAWTDHLILFTGNIFIDINPRIKNKDLFIEV